MKKSDYIYPLLRGVGVHVGAVFDVVQSPCKFGKILVVGNFIEQNFILKILVLEIPSKKISLIFLFTRYETAIIIQLSSYFLKMFLISFILKALNEVSQSNIIFLCIWSFKVNSIFIISGSFFLFSKLNINWLLLFFIVSSDLLLLYLIKVLATSLSVAKFYEICEALHVYCITTGSDSSNVTWIT